MITECPTCRGYGHHRGQLCEQCDGTGEVETHGSFQHELAEDPLKSTPSKKEGTSVAND